MTELLDLEPCDLGGHLIPVDKKQKPHVVLLHVLLTCCLVSGGGGGGGGGERTSSSKGIYLDSCTLTQYRLPGDKKVANCF